MNIEEYLKLAQHLDKIGAYTAADITEKNMVKTAADEPQRDVALQGQEPAGGGFWRRTFDRASISLTKLRDRETFIDESFKALNSYLAYASGVGFTDFANKLKEAKKELLVVAKQLLGRGRTPYTPPTGILPSVMRELSRASNVKAQGNFLDWSQSQAQIYVGNNRYYNYIYYLREAEVAITKKVNPNFTPGGIANTPTAITARRPRGGAPPPPPPPAPAGPAASIGSAGTYPGGTSSSPGRTPPKRSILPGTATNQALARIVFTKLRSMDPTKEDVDIHKSLRPEEKLSGYNLIGSDPAKIAEVKAAIDATRYSPAKKQKMKKLLDQKIEDARNMAIESATNPAISEPTSTVQPTSSTSNTPPLSEYPSERTGDLRELDTLISDMERKASSTDKTLFVNSYNADARLVHETFDRLRPNMNPSTISRYEHRLSRLELVFVREVNK